MKILSWASTVIFCFAFSLLGCGNSNSSSPNPTVSTTAVGWSQIHESIRCEAVPNPFCKGFFGFTIKTDSSYTIGGDSGSTTQTGQLTQDEGSKVIQDANSLVAAIPFNPQTCDNAVVAIPGNSDEVDMNLAGQSAATTVYQVPAPNSTSGGFCFLGGESNSENLHSDVLTLLNKYYPIPFPPGATSFSLRQ